MTPTPKLAAGFIKRIHVNQFAIRRNAKEGTREPVVTIKTSDANTRANTAVIYGQDGLEAARVVYSPDKPLSCGARLWIETHGRVEALDEANQGAPS